MLSRATRTSHGDQEGRGAVGTSPVGPTPAGAPNQNHAAWRAAHGPYGLCTRDPTPPRLPVTGPRRQPPARVWDLGARAGVRIGTVAPRRTGNARAGRKDGAQTLGGCRRGSRVVTRALSSRNRTNKTDLQLMRGVQSQQGRHLEGPAHPSPGCPPQATRGLPPRPWVDQHKTRSGEPAAIFVVSTNGSQPAWFTAPVDGPVVGASTAAPAGTLVTREGSPIDLGNSGGAAPEGRRGEPAEQRPVDTERAKWNASGQRTWRASGPATESTSAGPTRALEEPMRCLDEMAGTARPSPALCRGLCVFCRGRPIRAHDPSTRHQTTKALG